MSETFLSSFGGGERARVIYVGSLELRIYGESGCAETSIWAVGKGSFFGVLKCLIFLVN